MKKIMFVIIAAAMIIMLVSCTQQAASDKPVPDDQQTEAAQQDPLEQPEAFNKDKTALAEGYIFPDQDFMSSNYLEMEEDDAAALLDILILAEWTESSETEYTGPGISVIKSGGNDGTQIVCMYNTVYDAGTGTFYDIEYSKEYTCSSVERDIVKGVLEGYINL